MLSTLALCLFAALQAPRFDDTRQIFWQRSLDDALALSQAQQRPLLIAINADGESASERIVRERYRDPAWVEFTRPFVCVAGSVFRHTPRDYDDEGRRIACPRLGEITCGEHIAMEPAVHGRWFAGTKIELFGEITDRISPRHALIDPDGTKTLDQYLLFDLRELDTALAEAVVKARPFDPNHAREWPNHRQRLLNENSAADTGTHGGGPHLEWLVKEARSHTPLDKSWHDGVRRILGRKPLAPSQRDSIVELARDTTTESSTAAVAREHLTALTPSDASGSRTDQAAALDLCARLAGDQPATRTLLISYFALGGPEGGAGSQRSGGLAALHQLFGDASAHEVVSAIDRAGAAFDSRAFEYELMASRPRQPHVSKPQDPLPERAELELALEAADSMRATDRRGEEKFGRAALMLARRRLQDNATNGLDLLLQDADAALELAVQVRPDDATLLIDRARVAYYLSRIDQQEQHALKALKVLHFEPRSRPESLDDTTVEALRWLGDACARQLGTRAGGDPSAEAVGILHGGRSLALAAASREADATDWLSVASFFGALGRARERVAFVEEGLRRFPDDNGLRGELWSALSSLGRPEVLVEKSEQLASAFPSSAASAWYAGFALVLKAEWLRRGEDPDGAIAAYARAAPHFRRAIEFEPSFRDSSEHYLALSALGRGFAHLLANRQLEASRCAVEAARLRPESISVRDGLDREGVDLVDGVLEWRASGPSPVDALMWLEGFPIEPGMRGAKWVLAISDAELREGLRSDGRGEHELGDRQIAAAMAAARRTDFATTADSLLGGEGEEIALQLARAFAQAATIQAERWLERGVELPKIAAQLGEAARALGLEAPAADADERALNELAARLRSQLGEARPVFRAGR